MNEKLEVYYFKDLKEAGFGTRATVTKKVKLGIFPPPVDDGSGRPVWLTDVIEKYKASLEQYHPTPIKHIEEARTLLKSV